jgi:hypothetical protein
MSPFLTREVLGWGIGLWFFGYVLGFIFYGLVPADQIGWFVTPFGVAATLLVLRRYVHMQTLKDAYVVGIGWMLIAIALDYIGIVLLLAPADGYYKYDVYMYYALTLALPIVWFVVRRSRE